MTPNNIIAQHPKAVALSFLQFGYPGAINESTLKAMADFYGEPFLERLEANINSAGYSAPTIPIYRAEDPVFFNQGLEDIGLDHGMTKNPADFLPGGIYYQTTLPIDIDPTLIVPPAPPVYQTLDITPNPVKVPVKPPVNENGDPLGSGTGVNDTVFVPHDDMPPPQKKLPAPAVTTADSGMDLNKIWKKYSMIIIALTVLIAFAIISRRAAPVIIK